MTDRFQPLLEPASELPTRPAIPLTPARKKLRRAFVYALAEARSRRTIDPGRPTLKRARAYMRYFLPKTPDNKLLPLRCSDKEFNAHVGSGVALYMHFVKMTGYMFCVATLIAMPQFFGNWYGDELKLVWPFESICDPAREPSNFIAIIMGIVGKFMSLLGYFFYKTMLGNITFKGSSKSGGLLHLFSEMLLSMMFCVYVYWIWWYNSKKLAAIESVRTRTSDFAVLATGLPPRGGGSESVAQHFGFFGPINSVLMVHEQHELITLLARQQGLRVRWRQLHLEYRRAQRSLRAAARDPTSGVQIRAESHKGRRAMDKILAKMELVWVDLLHSREELVRASMQPVRCTGHAVVIFERMVDAARCVRHFERIRAYEKSRLGSDFDSPVDFRQMVYTTPRGLEYRVDAKRAPEPTDIKWENLRASPRVVFQQNMKTTSIMITIAFFSCIAIVAVAVYTTAHPEGFLGIPPVLWTTPVIIISNVAIFASVPALSINLERHHTRSSQHTHMLLKMLFFQVANTFLSAFALMFLAWANPDPKKTTCPIKHPLPFTPVYPSCPVKDPVPFTCNSCFPFSFSEKHYNLDFNYRCVHHWYTTGPGLLVNGLFGDFTAILLIIELLRPCDKLPTRYIFARLQPTQAQMNDLYGLDGVVEFYLPFRYQLTLKWVVLSFMFCSAIPILLPAGAFFCGLSYYIDRYNFLRVFKPPPRTTDRTVTMSVLLVLPICAFLHVLFAVFFYAHQANQPIPVAYYLLLLTFAIFVLSRVANTLASQTERPTKDPSHAAPAAETASLGYADTGGDGRATHGNGDGNGNISGNGSVHGGAARASATLRAHLESLNLYVPPLTAQVLTEHYKASAASCVWGRIGEGDASVTPSENPSVASSVHAANNFGGGGGGGASTTSSTRVAPPSSESAFTVAPLVAPAAAATCSEVPMPDPYAR